VYDKDISTSKKNFEFLDIEDYKSLLSIKGNDVIINLAALHHDNVLPVSRYDDVNVQGSINICNAARKYGIKKIIFTSSVAVYGFSTANADESGAHNYFNDYGRTKHLAEKVFIDWQKENLDRTIIIIRPTVVFGEGNRGNVYNLLKQIASGKFFMIGNGKNKKSMAYVENVAAFLEYSLSFNPGIHIYNYIDKPDLDMNTLVSKVRNILFTKNNIGIRLPASLGVAIGYLADIIAKISGKNFPISSIRIKKFLGTTQFRSSIGKTNFVPPVSLEEGLERTLRYEFIEDNSNQKTFKTE
jgi:nucleoside-diphosphate-sugar epimerase